MEETLTVTSVMGTAIVVNGAIAPSTTTAHALGFLNAWKTIGPTFPAATSDPALFIQFVSQGVQKVTDLWLMMTRQRRALCGDLRTKAARRG